MTHHTAATVTALFPFDLLQLCTGSRRQGVAGGSDSFGP